MSVIEGVYDGHLSRRIRPVLVKSPMGRFQERLVISRATLPCRYLVEVALRPL